MTILTPLLEAFNSGEFSPRMASRLSFKNYPFGAAILENLIPLVEGGLTRRPGTRYVAALKDETAAARVLPFVFSTTQAYVIEAGNSVMRFFRNQGQITVPDTNAVVTNGTFTSNITDWDDRSSGTASISHNAALGALNLVGASASVAWAEQDIAVSSANKDNVHVLKFRVLGVAGDTITFRVGTTSTGAELVNDVELGIGYHCHEFTPGATTFYVQFRNSRAKTVQIDDVSLIDNAPVEIDSIYTASDLSKIKFSQSHDVLFLVHPTIAWRKLTRRGHSSWSLTEVDNLDGPYLDVNTTATTLTPAATTGLGVNVTASSVTGINNNQGFLSTDVGRLIRIDNPASGVSWGYARIRSVTSTTVVVVDIKRNFGTTNAGANWALSAFSDTTGHPSAIGFFEQRMLLGGTTTQPKTFWGSQSVADYENMQPDNGSGTVEDDDAFNFTLGSGSVDAIRWIAGGKRLFIGTTSGEWLVSSSGSIITPSDIEVDENTTHGSADIPPLKIGHTVLFIQKAKRRVRELSFDFDIDGIRSIDLNVLAFHILKGGAVEMAYQQEPWSVIWVVRNDGVLCSMTFNREEQNIVGWGRHILGGSFGTGDPVVESVTTIPGNNGSGQTKDSSNRDEVWLVVKRTINGATRRYIEFMEAEFEGPRKDDFTTTALWRAQMLSDQKDAYYSDALLTYDSTSTTTITGLDHLEGAQVAILGDGANLPAKTVASGSITISPASAKVQVGLAYQHKFKSLRLIRGGKIGSPIGYTERIKSVGYDLLDTGAMSIGVDIDNQDDIDFRVPSDPMDSAVPLFSGEGTHEFDGDFELDPRIVVVGSIPMPLTILSLSPRMEISEK